jgi:phosphonoacetaldehyde hydrolase
LRDVKALEDVFSSAGVSVSRSAIRRYMGVAKKDHVRLLLKEYDVTHRWKQLYGACPASATEPQSQERRIFT